MGMMISNTTDVVAFLKEQHQQVRALFEQLLTCHGQQRKTTFEELCRLIAVHETVEEEIVHPAARRALPDGSAVVVARLREELGAKEALVALEKLDLESLEFLSRVSSLELAVLEHAEAEETEEFDRLAGEIDPRRIERMRKAAELAESLAPTHPHLQSRDTNILVGPFASMIDRARDALAKM